MEEGMDSGPGIRTTWICTDLIASYDEVEPDKVHRFRAHRDEYLCCLEGFLDDVAEESRRDNDGVKAIFYHAREGLDAAREVDQIASRTDFPFDFRSRIGVHTELSRHILEGDYSEGAAKAMRIMQMCPRGYILCSEDALDGLEDSARARSEIYGPIFCKLRGPARPVPLCAIPGMTVSGPPVELAAWQTGDRRWPSFIDPLGVIRTRGFRPYLAAIFCEMLWASLRDPAFYRLGNWGFRVLNCFTRRLGLDFDIETSRGVADTHMLARRTDRALEWAERAKRVAGQVRYPSDREFCEAMGRYQVAHCMEHGGLRRQDALGDLIDAYKSFERIGDPRMGEWAALYLARCLRLLGQKPAAEDWTLASIVIFSCIPRERPLAYALAQMGRLRAGQDRLPQARWYLEQARRLYGAAVGRAADDAVGEAKLADIWSRTQCLSESCKSSMDPARRIVETTLARAFPGRYRCPTGRRTATADLTLDDRVE